MVCTYTYGSGEQQVSASSIEELKQILFTANGKGLKGQFRQFLDDQLKFFNATDSQKVAGIIQDCIDNPTNPSTGAISPTTVGERFYGKHQIERTDRYDGNSGEEDLAAKKIRQFRKNFGDLFHKCLEYAYDETKVDRVKYAEAEQKLIDLCAAFKKEYDIAEALGPGGMFRTVPNALRLGLDDFFKNFDETRFSESIRKATDAVHDLFPNGHFRCEVPIWINSETANFSGRVDAIVWDDEGNVTIIDFKTASNDRTSQAGKLSHLCQLEIYKQILASKGIPVSKIKVCNLRFVFDGTSKIKTPTLEDPGQDLGIEAAEAKSMIYEYFPLEGKHLPKEESDRRLTQFQTFTQGICNGLMLKRFEKDSIMRDLERCVVNNHPRFMEQSESNTKIVQKWETQGDKIIGKNAKNETLCSGTLEELAEKEIESQNELVRKNVGTLTDVLRQKDRVGLLTFIKSKSLQKQYGFYHALYKYMSPRWKYIKVDELERNGVIVLKDEVDNTYEFVIAIADSSNLEFIRDPKDNILKNIMMDQNEIGEVKQFEELPQASIGNMYRLKGLLAISEFSDLLEDSPSKINISGINAVSMISGTQDSTLGLGLGGLRLAIDVMSYEAEKNPDKIEQAEYVKSLCDKAKNLNILELSDNIDKVILRKVEDAISIVALENVDDSYLQSLSGADLWEREAELEKLLTHLKEIYGKDACESATTKIGLLYSDISHFLLKLKNLTPETMNMMHKRSLTFQESILAGIDLLRYGEVNRFSKMGMRLTGLAQGLETSVSYASPDELVRKANALFDAYSAQIVSDLTKEAEEVNKATKEFLKSEGRTDAQALVSGNYDDAYFALLEKDEQTGKPKKAMRFINPYSRTSGLASYQQQYLEVILWTINRHRMGNLLSTEKDRAMLKLSYAELSKPENKELKDEYINLVLDNVELLEVPLKKRQGFVGSFSNFRNLLNGNKSPKQFIKEETDKWKSYFDPTVLNEEQAKLQEENISELKYTNFYKDVRDRASKTANTEVNEWEINLNKLVLDYAAADYKEVYFTKLLGTVDKQFATIRLMEIVTGQDLSAQTEALQHRIRVSIYNKSLVEPEDEDLIKVMSSIKGVSSLAKIAVRPALLVKEMILGRIRNTSAILAKQITNDSDISMKHLMDAAKVVFGGEFFRDDNKKLLGGKSVGDFGFVELLNNIYTINDRDLNVIGESLAFDRHGVHNWGSRMLYLNTIAPDYFNRMIIFIAKMKADGTYDAHEVNDQGQLVYKMSADSRINEFWNNKDTNRENDKTWVDQKALYVRKMQQFASEGWKNPDGSPLNWGQNMDAQGRPIYDPFPRAYTAQEQDSIKEQIGLIYGYYGHEERANVQKGWWWTMYTQFLTYLPSEIRKYLAPGNIESSVGKTVQLKDPVSGKKLYWQEDPDTHMKRKVVAGTNGISEEGFDESGKALEPVLGWQSNPIEGLAISTAKTLGQVCRRDWEGLKANPQQIRNTELFLFNLLFGFLIASIIAALLEAGVDTKSNAAVGASLDILNKTGNELNFIQNIYGSVSQFGLVGTDFLQEIAGNIGKTISQDGYDLLDFANNTFSIVKDTHLVN